MPNMGTQPINEPTRYYTVEAAAQLTGRSEQAIRRYIRNRVVDSIQDPTDGRRRLIPWLDLAKVLTQPMKGKRLRPVAFTKSDGTTITRMLPMRKEEGPRP